MMKQMPYCMFSSLSLERTLIATLSTKGANWSSSRRAAGRSRTHSWQCNSEVSVWMMFSACSFAFVICDMLFTTKSAKELK